MRRRLHIKDYPEFNPALHHYIVSTGTGSWNLATPSITGGIKWDIKAFKETLPRGKRGKIDWRDWVNFLAVYEGNQMIAEFNLITWKWETLSRGTKEEL